MTINTNNQMTLWRATAYLKTAMQSVVRLAILLTLPMTLPAQRKDQAMPQNPVYYRTVKVDGLNIFYREAGPKDAPVILLLHSEFRRYSRVLVSI
jgi:hypothetical protein